MSVAQHELQTGIAAQAARDLGVDDGAAFELAPRDATAIVEPGVHDHRGTIGVLIAGDPLRGQRVQRIGKTLLQTVLRGQPIVLIGVVGKAVGDSPQRLGDDGSLRRRKLRLESETPTLVEPPPTQEAAALDVARLVQRGGIRAIGPPSDGGR